MIRQIKANIYSVGAIDFDRRLFDELIPLPNGTSYNSYVIKGSEKTALIDSVDFSKEQVLIDNLKELGVDQIDYVIAHHGEQDHSGVIPVILKHFPVAKVVTNNKCKDILKELLLIPDEKFIVITDKQTISLGDKTLQFIIAPWVHWPDTMFTYLQEDKILFTCDFLGSHLATSDLFVIDEGKCYESAKRYYAEIMMPFRSNIRQHLDKIKPYNIDIIAPSHGHLHNKPEFIINAYKEWTSDTVKNEVVLPYVSMHGSVQKMVDYFIDALVNRNIIVKPFNLTKTDLGELAMSLVDAATIVIGSSTVLTGPHPNVINAVYLANALRPKTCFASIIGSYGWAGKMVEKITEMMLNLKVELIEPVVAKGYPKEDGFKKLDQLADKILAKHKEKGII
jgi:flavorubredoxin